MFNFLTSFFRKKKMFSTAELEIKAKEIVDLCNGGSGPYCEDEETFFGKKRVNSSMKDAKMETDCGGIITKAKMTYGEADAIAAAVDLQDCYNFIITCSGPQCYWKCDKVNRNPYKGEIWWAIYSYLATKKIIEGNPSSYKNTLEYLYDEILVRLVAANLVEADEYWRYFKIHE